jgi:ABC-type antimicrobial peptide transport system permease subunit
MIRGLSLASPGVIIGGLMAFIWVNWMRDEYLSRDVSSGTIGWAVVFGLVLLVFAASIGPARYAGSMSPAGQLRED